VTYGSIFLRHHIDGLRLQTLSSKNIKEDLGIASVGHRIKLLLAIGQFANTTVSVRQAPQPAPSLTFSSRRSMKERWLLQIETVLRGLNGRVMLGDLGQFVPRPEGYREQLKNLLQNDRLGRFQLSDKHGPAMTVYLMGHNNNKIINLSDQGSIEIMPKTVRLHENEDGRARITSQGDSIEQEFCIKNISQARGVVTNFSAARLSHNHHSSFTILPYNPLLLGSGQEISLKLNCRPRHVGMLRTTLFFDFLSHDNQNFTIGRMISIRCGDAEIEDLLRPTCPYMRVRKGRVRKYGKNMIEGKKPPGSQVKFAVGLDEFEIQQSLRTLASNREQLREMFQALKDGLPHTYGELFSKLLWVEEMSMEVDIRAFDMDRARMAKEGAYLALEVPGLSENRPSVLRGDCVIATFPDRKSVHYKGYAFRIERDRVLLKFCDKLHTGFISGQEMHITFTFKRTPLKLMHQGVNHRLRTLHSITFPNPTDLCNPSKRAEGIRWFNCSLNDEQRLAVQSILEGTACPAPYIIFGPPGECILQILQHSARITSKLSSLTTRQPALPHRPAVLPSRPDSPCCPTRNRQARARR
jgi:hypothetical protein